MVADWEAGREERLVQLQAEGRAEEVEELKGKKRTDVMGVLEWTGPGLFTDAVMA